MLDGLVIAPIGARLVRLCFCFLVVFHAPAVLAQTASAATDREHPPGSQSPRFAALVIDAASGEVLYEEEADEPRYPASLTKMLTLYLLFQRLAAGTVSFDTSFPVTAHAASMQPTKLNLVPGTSVRVEDLMLGLITRSANDGAVVLAEGLAGSETAFAEEMTEVAHRLGMKHSHFANASGLPDPEQVTTAHDMAALARALLRDFPDYYRYFGTRSFTYKGEAVTTHNGMLGSYPGLDGIKTGFIHASGYNLVASAKRDGRRLIGVVFGGTSNATRNAQMAKLLDAAFDGRAVVPELRIAKAKPNAGPKQMAAWRPAGDHRKPETPHKQTAARPQAAAARSFLGDLQATAALRQILDGRAGSLGLR